MSDFTIFVGFVLAIFWIIAWALTRVAVWECKRDIAKANAAPLRGDGGRFKSRNAE